jgi:hypothetical protein
MELMKRIVGAALVILSGATVSGLAEDAKTDVKTPWDIAFGGALMTDDNIRGISLSDHRPGFEAYVEPRYDFSKSLQAYVRVDPRSLTLENRAAAAVEIFAGVRPVFDRLALDFGVWEHWLPGGQCFDFRKIGGRCIPPTSNSDPSVVPAQLSYWEAFANATYSVDRQLSFGSQLYWSPSVLNSGAEATYVSGWAKYILPRVLPEGMGWFVMAEAGHWFRESTPYPSYSNWNAGLAFTWKQFTLDLRYSNTDRPDCLVPVLAAVHTSNRCGETFIARLGFDLTKANLK